ncbi:MAG: FAD-dependent oxidoreductase, partial [Clostridia bacterium]|nr:FAD-dependent oxidoreductase [Clostridia bacterium]
MNHYDLIVLGGGITGVCAAVAAGRRGQKVLLIEKSGSLGGAMVNMYVNPFMRYFTGNYNENKIVNKGLFIEILNDLKEMGGMASHACFNEEYMKVVLDRKCTQAGVQVLFLAHFIGLEKEGDTIKSITVETRMGPYTFSADTFIDASGDAMLAYKAGCPVQVGREEDNACQPMTLCFRMAGVNMTLFKAAKPAIQLLYNKFQAEGKIKNPRENVLTFIHTSDGVLHLNSTRVVGLSTLDPFDISKASMIAREQMMELFYFLKENAPGCKNATLLSSAPEIGVRESRMIKGAYTLTADDLLECREFEDSIAVGCYSIDIHSPDGSGTTIKKIPAGKWYHIPYRTLLPQKADNLLVAGRTISSTHEAQSAYRVLPIVANIGEAAGLAAYLSKAESTSLAEVPMDK